MGGEEGFQCGEGGGIVCGAFWGAGGGPVAVHLPDSGVGFGDVGGVGVGVPFWLL